MGLKTNLNKRFKKCLGLRALGRFGLQKGSITGPAVVPEELLECLTPFDEAPETLRP